MIYIHVHQMDLLFQEWLCDSSHLDRLEMKSHLKRFAWSKRLLALHFRDGQKFMRWYGETIYVDVRFSNKNNFSWTIVAVSREPFRGCWPWFHLPVRQVVGQFFLNCSKVFFADLGLQVELESCSMALCAASCSHIGYMAIHDPCSVCSSLLEHFCMQFTPLQQMQTCHHLYQNALVEILCKFIKYNL